MTSFGNQRLGLKLVMMLQVVLFAAGVGFLISNLVTLGHLFKYWDAASWPQENVRVTISQLNYPDTRNVGCAQPHIEYLYEHDGAERRSNRWGFSIQTCGAPSWAQQIVDRYPRGWQQAHIDPDSGRAVLDTDTSALWFIAAAGPACLLLFVIILRFTPIGVANGK